jgi:hypothetical protein
MSAIHLSAEQRREMKKVTDRVDSVTRADAKFFERFPDRRHRVRLASHDEICQHEIIDGHRICLPVGCRLFVAVRNIAPAVRMRLFVRGIEGAETDLDESTACQIFEAWLTPQAREIEAQMRKAAEARG